MEGKNNHTLFEKFSNGVIHFTSSSHAFLIAMIIVLSWLLTGLKYGFSDLWLSVIGAITGVFTFLMVFIIQKSQNKESMAIQLKLNELLAASTRASNRLVGIEELPEEELDKIYTHFRTLVEASYEKAQFNVSHSIEEAIEEAIEVATAESSSDTVAENEGEEFPGLENGFLNLSGI